jgi:hypothetical protein
MTLPGVATLTFRTGGPAGRRMGDGMPFHVQKGLATIGIGLLIGFLGLIWVANLFGVADEHARRISKSRLNRWMSGERRSPEEVRNSTGFRRQFNFGRFVSGGGFMAVGLIFIIIGLYTLVTPAS